MREGSGLSSEGRGIEASRLSERRRSHAAARSLASLALGIAAAAAFWLIAAVVVPALGGGSPSIAASRGPGAMAPGAARGAAAPVAAGAETGAVAAAAPPGTADRRKGLSGTELVRFTSGYLKPEALAGVSAQSAAKRAGAWIAAIEAAGGDPLAAVDEILPSSAWFQARLIHDRDEEGLASSASEPGPYGDAYAAILETLEPARSSATGVEATFGEVWKATSFPKASGSRLSPPLHASERWLPEVSEMEASHRHALDVFFKSVRRRGAAEIGPSIRSVSPGIVVSASGDWKGGDSPSAYRSGGLSPKAGNGAIVFDPGSRRYYAYFHLYDVRVRPGQAVAAGDILGRGGNTGVNARKKGHGAHVHLEIHDADGDAWTSYSIRDFVLALR